VPAPSILIVDDNALMLLTLTRILEQHGFCVLGANTARRGLQLVQEQPVDLVIMDYHLPDGDMELGPTLKRMRPGLPVVVFSGDPEAAQAAAFADLLLPKPQEPERVVAEIRRLLRGAGAERAA
jgi:DNA-binding response OmpR family regulator